MVASTAAARAGMEIVRMYLEDAFIAWKNNREAFG